MTAPNAKPPTHFAAHLFGHFKDLIHVNSFAYDFILHQFAQMVALQQLPFKSFDLVSVAMHYFSCWPLHPNFARSACLCLPVETSAYSIADKTIDPVIILAFMYSRAQELGLKAFRQLNGHRIVFERFELDQHSDLLILFFIDSAAMSAPPLKYFAVRLDRQHRFPFLYAPTEQTSHCVASGSRRQRFVAPGLEAVSASSTRQLSESSSKYVFALLRRAHSMHLHEGVLELLRGKHLHTVSELSTERLADIAASLGRVTLVQLDASLASLMEWPSHRWVRFVHFCLEQHAATTRLVLAEHLLGTRVQTTKDLSESTLLESRLVLLPHSPGKAVLQLAFDREQQRVEATVLAPAVGRGKDATQQALALQQIQGALARDFVHLYCAVVHMEAMGCV